MRGLRSPPLPPPPAPTPSHPTPPPPYTPKRYVLPLFSLVRCRPLFPPLSLQPSFSRKNCAKRTFATRRARTKFLPPSFSRPRPRGHPAAFLRRSVSHKTRIPCPPCPRARYSRDFDGKFGIFFSKDEERKDLFDSAIVARYRTGMLIVKMF